MIITNGGLHLSFSQRRTKPLESQSIIRLPNRLHVDLWRLHESPVGFMLISCVSVSLSQAHANHSKPIGPAKKSPLGSQQSGETMSCIHLLQLSRLASWRLHDARPLGLETVPKSMPISCQKHGAGTVLAVQYGLVCRQSKQHHVLY